MIDQNKAQTPLSRKTVSELQQDIFVSEKLTGFLDNCDNSYGNVFELKQVSPDGTEFLGHGRLEDGTPIRILGYTKKAENGSMTMPFRIVTLPKEKYNKKSKREKEPDWMSEETKNFLNRKRG